MFLMLATEIAQFKHRMLIILVLGVLGTNNLFSAGDYYRFMLKENWATQLVTWPTSPKRGI